MSLTRRHLMGAAVAALARPSTVAQAPAPVEPYPFTEAEYEQLAVTLMVVTGLSAGTPEGAAMVGHLLFGDPIPDEMAWTRDRCRHALATLTQRLNA